MSQTSTGARVIFYKDGTPIMYANALNYTVNHAMQPVDIMGQLEPKEYAETGYTVNFTCTMFRVSGQDAVSLGLRPILQDILTQEGLTVTMIDRVSGARLMLVEQVKCTSESFNIDARSMGQATLEFVGIKLSNESRDASTSRKG